MNDDENVDLVHLIDRVVKNVFRDCPTLVTRLAGLTVAPQNIRVEDSNLNLPELRADHVFVLTESDAEPEGAIYLEYQLRPDPKLLPTWATKWAGLSRQLGIPVALVVLYLQKGDRATFPFRLRAQIGGFETELRFTAIRLWEQSERIRSGELAELAPLLLLSEENPTLETLQEEADLIHNASLPPDTEADLLNLILMVGSRHFSREILRTFFQREIDTMQDLGLIGDWLEDREARGKARGETEGTRKTVLRFLVNRFGTLPEALLERIEQANADWCNNLLDRAITAESLSELADLYVTAPE